MKKSIIGSILGLAVAATVGTSYGQGFVQFSSYVANSGIGALTYYNPGAQLANNTFYANLYFAFPGAAVNSNDSDPIGIPSSPFARSLDPNANVQYATGAATAGYFDGGAVAIPGYTVGSISFIVAAYQGGTFYGDALNTFRGHSAVFTMNSIATGSQAAPALGDNGGPLIEFTAQATVPEPSTFALIGLGAGALLFFRRRK